MMHRLVRVPLSSTRQTRSPGTTEDMSLTAPAQVFGGCCTNAYLLEAFLGASAGLDAGPLISLCQVVLVCSTALHSRVDFSQPRRLFLKRTHVPATKLLFGAVLFYSMSALGNSIYLRGVSVPVQIAFRSCSVVFSMAVSAALGKRYLRAQVLAAGLMTVGTFLLISQHSALSGAGGAASASGLVLLAVSSVLAAFLGLYTETVFAQHGHHWQEVLFFNHFLSIPLLLLTSAPQLRHGLAHVLTAPPLFFLPLFGAQVPVSRLVLLLCLNSTTQIFCARGVNHLSSVASSVTVAVVLLVRKFASLVISACVFGPAFSVQGVVGSGLLIAGTLLYAHAKRDKEEGRRR